MVDNFSTQRIIGLHAEKSRVHDAQLQNAASRYAIEQESMAEDFQQWSETLNPVAVAVRRFDNLETRLRRRPKETETEKTEKADADEEILQVEKLSEISEQFERSNPELHARNLLALRSRIKNSDTPEEILEKVLEAYPDHSLADEALDFLARTSSGQLAEKILLCRERFNEVYGREIRAGRNIHITAREFSSKGLGSPTGLRDLYRDVTGNPREALTLFEELTTKYPFDKMKTIISFLLHSLGSDPKSKGPSIARGELHRLTSETRSLQAILGVFRYFQSRMSLINNSFSRNDLMMSSRVTFEYLSKLFVKFLMERYPSSDKIYQMGVHLGLSDELIAEMIIFTQMRDGVRQISPRLFRNEQHKQEVLKAFIEVLEDLEERLEEDDDEEEDDDNNN